MGGHARAHLLLHTNTHLYEPVCVYVHAYFAIYLSRPHVWVRLTSASAPPGF